MDISRRNFIKATLAMSAAAAAGITPDKADAQAAKNAGSGEREVLGVCRMCGTGCSVVLTVKDGKVIGMKGNVASKTNTKGFLCVKGMNIYKVMYHPDRLTKPLIRDNKTGKFKEASWNEALDLIANTFKKFQSKYGYDSVAYYGSGQCTTEESYTFNKLWKGGFGSNMVDGNPRLCMASAVAGYLTSLGSDEPVGTYEDIEQAKCIFLTGSNTAECHPILFRRIANYKRANPNVKIIVCEPRRTKTSAIADLWMPFNPGADGAIFNGMAREIIKNNWHDKKFIDSHTVFAQMKPGEDGKPVETAVTFEDYVKFIDKYTPEFVEKTTGCPAASVKQAAEWFAKSGATLSMWCMGLNQRSNGVFVNNQIHNLHAITGNFGKPGADSFSLTGQPNACGGVRETGSLSHLLPGCKPVANKPWREKVEAFWKVKEFCINPTKQINPKPGFHAVKLFSSLGAESDAEKPVKGVIISTTNPAQTLPNTNRFLNGLKNAFTVVIDIFPTRTAQLATVILPAAFIYEKGGVYGCSERRSFLTRKAVDAPGECKPDLWIACEIAKRMGLGEFIPWSKEKDIVSMYKGAWFDYISCTKDTEKSLWGAPYEELLKSSTGAQWPIPEVKHPGTYKRYVPGMDPVFDNPGRYFSEEKAKELLEAKKRKDDIYFYMMPKGKMKVWLRPHENANNQSQKISAEYPFLMTTGRVLEQWHTGTMTMRIAETAQAHPYSFIEIHEDDAKELKIGQGDMIKVESSYGSNILPARIVKMTLKGVVFVPMHDQKKDRMVNYMCSDIIDAASSEPDYKVTAVKLTRISGPQKIEQPRYVVDRAELDNPQFS